MMTHLLLTRPRSIRYLAAVLRPPLALGLAVAVANSPEGERHRPGIQVHPVRPTAEVRRATAAHHLAAVSDRHTELTKT